MTSTPTTRPNTTRPSPVPGDLLTVTEAAQHLGTPVRFIRRLVAERRIPFYKIGRYVRINTHDLDHFIQDGRIEAAGASGPSSTGWAL